LLAHIDFGLGFVPYCSLFYGEKENFPVNVADFFKFLRIYPQVKKYLSYNEILRGDLKRFMLQKKNNNTWLILTFLIGLSLACGLGEQTDEANKFVVEANVIIEKNNALIDKSNRLFTELLGDNLTKVEDMKGYKEKNKSKFDEVISLTGQIEKSSAEAIDKFEQASKLKLSEKYKEYLDIKIQEMKKRTEAHKLVVPFVEEFLQTNDMDKINKLIEDFNEQNIVIDKEVNNLSEKVEQIKKDNPTVIEK